METSTDQGDKGVTYKSGDQLFAAPCHAECVEAAKQYIKDNAYTQDEVKIVKRGEEVMVIWR